MNFQSLKQRMTLGDFELAQMLLHDSIIYLSRTGTGGRDFGFGDLCIGMCFAPQLFDELLSYRPRLQY